MSNISHKVPRDAYDSGRVVQANVPEHSDIGIAEESQLFMHRQLIGGDFTLGTGQVLKRHLLAGWPIIATHHHSIEYFQQFSVAGSEDFELNGLHRLHLTTS
jgi:hypothetical protein